MGPWADVLFKVPPTSFILNIFISTLSLESNFKVTCFLWLIGWYLRTAGTAAMTWFEARIVLNANLYQTNASKLYFIIINFPRFLPLPGNHKRVFNASGQKFTLSWMIKCFGFNFLFRGTLKANSSFVIFPSILLIDFAERKENRRLDWTNKINHHEKELYQADFFDRPFSCETSK